MEENPAEVEAAIVLAIEEKKKNPFASIRGLAKRFQMPRSTLQARYNGRQNKMETSKKQQLLHQ